MNERMKFNLLQSLMTKQQSHSGNLLERERNLGVAKGLQPKDMF